MDLVRMCALLARRQGGCTLGASEQQQLSSYFHLFSGW